MTSRPSAIACCAADWLRRRGRYHCVPVTDFTNRHRNPVVLPPQEGPAHRRRRARRSLLLGGSTGTRGVAASSAADPPPAPAIALSRRSAGVRRATGPAIASCTLPGGRLRPRRALDARALTQRCGNNVHVEDRFPCACCGELTLEEEPPDTYDICQGMRVGGRQRAVPRSRLPGRREYGEPSRGTRELRQARLGNGAAMADPQDSIRAAAVG